MRGSPKFGIHLTVLLCLTFLGSCATPTADDLSKNPYYTLCSSSILGVDIAEFLETQRIECLPGLSDLGSIPWLIRGTPKERFRARSLVLAKVKTDGWKVSWPADSIVLMNEWDQLGIEQGPWVRLASVRHRDTSTEALLERLQHIGIPSHFMFGETSDVIFVKAKDSAAAIALLKRDPDSAVTIHIPTLCSHHPPTVIRKNAPTVLTLTLAGSDTDRPLRERVDDLTCFHKVPGRDITGGYTMRSKQLPDGTLVATYEVPAMPGESTGSIAYHFTFKLDGRDYWYGSMSDPFRVPLE
jgi:hypothetical protein